MVVTAEQLRDHAVDERRQQVLSLRREASARLVARPAVRVLLVQLEPDVAPLLRAAMKPALDQDWLRLEPVGSAEAAVRAATQGQVDACLLDWTPESITAAAAVVHALDRLPGRPVLIGLSRRALPGDESAALDLGFSDVIDLEDLNWRRLDRAVRLAAHRQRAAARLDRMAHQDPLTGLGNRTFLHDRLEHAIATARQQRREVAVMLLDLDGFKAINDGLGHAAGDDLLRAVGERFKARLRSGDTIARLGGDEFAFVAEGLQSAADAAAVARKLMSALEPPFTVEGREVSVSGSLGIARFPVDATESAALLRLADAAMYGAKLDGGHTPSFHDPRTVRRTGGERPDASLQFERLLREEQVALCFEPQTPLASDRAGVGIVLRWPDEMPKSGAGSGRALAEEQGVAELLTRWLLERVCVQARAWQKLFQAPFHLALPLIARRQLAWPDLATTIQDELQRHGLPRAALEIEIEETVLLAEMAAGGGALEPLRRMGIRLAVTEFGRTHGALRLLQDAPVQTVKLSPHLTNGVPGDETGNRLLRGLLRLAHDMRLRVVADGTGSRAQLAYLRSLGCDAVQRTPRTQMLDAEDCTAWLDLNLPRPARLR